MQRAQNTNYMNDDLMHTLLDIAGISLNGYEEARSILSEDSTLLKSRARMVGNRESAKDYDKELRLQEIISKE
ncbi:hypothetical protein [Helicobacter typhlonius]|uniref:hypothetical protein n=1 Tax=Helicobacter typhlonius TaxID=76936 RepID=UPI002FE06BED